VPGWGADDRSLVPLASPLHEAGAACSPALREVRLSLDGEPQWSRLVNALDVWCRIGLGVLLGWQLRGIGARYLVARRL
jgi:hypothetical protein